MHTLSYAINFWSKGEMSALFLRHEGFLGATGAFFVDEHKQQMGLSVSSVSSLASETLPASEQETLEKVSRSAVGVGVGVAVAVADGIAAKVSSPAPEDLANTAPAAVCNTHLQRRRSSKMKHTAGLAPQPGTPPDNQLPQPPGNTASGSRRSKSYSFTENFSITETIADEAVSSLGMLDRQSAKLLPLPQLINSSREPYQPDTVDLSKNLEQQEYWITTMERNTHGLLDLADNGTLANDEATRLKLSRFVTLYQNHLCRLRDRPLAYGPMSVRTLLGLREQCLHEVGLEDIFAQVKSRETDAALMALPMMLAQTDRIGDPAERLRVLVRNVLAGNMFDWGSTDLRDKMADGTLGFEEAKRKITWQPQFDNTDDFVAAVVGRRVRYRKAVVFVDNSGADVCLGVLPFARFLLSFVGSKVILASNSRPALNDVTERELADIVRRAARVDEEISRAVSERQLLVCGTGCSGPCVDLRKLDERLVKHCHNADLVVIVGMGRAIHSNYHAKFACDSLKLAVFKSKMAADAAHANVYDGLSLFVPNGLHLI
ncbi:hypothetical protein GGI23_004428 [Coemansia sp. RSA 2559]|nr:hypothetical protein GGI23_004428 [Coemansia sp. RSA 2559]